MRAHLHASVGVLKIGNDILFKEEKIKVDRITGHGGLFKTKGVGQRILAAAINSPISVMETAGEGYAGIEVSPTAEDVEGFNAYIENYKANLPVEEAAVKSKR